MSTDNSLPVAGQCSGIRTIKLTVAYDGTAYAGWQLQPVAPTIQGAIEAVLIKITREENLRVTGSGRTDSGVHALGQVVSFRTSCGLTPEVFLRAMNAFLPADIVVLTAEEVAQDFHAIRSSKRKRYRYVIDDGALPDLFQRSFSWRCWHRLDVDLMQQAALSLLGTHDFSSFETAGSPRATSIRTVYDLMVSRPNHSGEASGNLIWIEIEANGFLYNMVRTIVGSLVLVGKKKEPVHWLEEALLACDRRKAGQTAPPQGLFLLRVDY